MYVPADFVCGDWIAIVEQAGFAVRVEEMAPESLSRHKAALGIPDGMQSCHTATIAGYALEGHVPVADILRLLDARPDAVGLAVPGMLLLWIIWYKGFVVDSVRQASTQDD